MQELRFIKYMVLRINHQLQESLSTPVLRPSTRRHSEIGYPVGVCTTGRRYHRSIKRKRRQNNGTNDNQKAACSRR